MSEIVLSPTPTVSVAAPPIVAVDAQTAGAQGIPGATGAQGPKGDTGAQGPQGPIGNTGVGVPTGGVTGQFLYKNSNAQYDTSWQNANNQWDAVVTKSADQSVANSTTLVADTQLFFTPINGSVYYIVLLIAYSSPLGGSVPDINLTFGQDAVIRGSLNAIGISTGDGAGGSNSQAQTGQSVAFGTAAVKRLVRMEVVYTGSGAQAGLWWSQNVLNTNVVYVHAGSVLQYRKIV